MKIESPAKIKPIAPISNSYFCSLRQLLHNSTANDVKNYHHVWKGFSFFKLSSNQLASYTDTSGLIILSSMFVGAEASWDESKEYL